MTTVVLPLSAGSMIISVSLLRSCRAIQGPVIYYHAKNKYEEEKNQNLFRKCECTM